MRAAAALGLPLAVVDRDGDRLVLRIAFGDERPDLLGDAIVGLLRAVLLVVGAIHPLDDASRPVTAGVAAPEQPRDEPGARVRRIVPAGPLVHGVPGEVGRHASDGVRRERLAVLELRRSSDADLGAAAVELAAEPETSVGLGRHLLRRREVDVAVSGWSVRRDGLRLASGRSRLATAGRVLSRRSRLGSGLRRRVHEVAAEIETAAERHSADDRNVGLWNVEPVEAAKLADLVDGQYAGRDQPLMLLQVKRPVRRDRIVVGEDRLVLQAEHREELLVERLLVEPKHRQDGRFSPLGEAGLAAREVRIVRLEHRDRHAEDGCDLLDDLVATAKILRRERHRLEVHLSGERDELAGLARTAKPLVDGTLELRDRLVGRVLVLDRREVVRPCVVRRERQVHLVECVVQIDRTPGGFHLAETVEQIIRIRPLEVQHLVRLERDLVLSLASVRVSGDELLRIGNDLDPLRRHRPEFGRHSERVRNDVQVGVAGELLPERPRRREVKAVHRRVHLAEQVEDRMRLGDLLELGSEVVQFGQHGPRRRPLAIAQQVRLPSSSDLRRPVELATGSALDVEPKRHARDAERVDLGGREYPRAVLADGHRRRVDRPLVESRASRDDPERRL